MRAIIAQEQWMSAALTAFAPRGFERTQNGIPVKPRLPFELPANQPRLDLPYR